MRLNKKAVNVRYVPQFVGPHPDGVRHIYMENIFALGVWGMCLPKKGAIRIKKGNIWAFPEDLPAIDLLPHYQPSGSSGSHKKKKGRKGKKGGPVRQAPRRRR